MSNKKNEKFQGGSNSFTLHFSLVIEFFSVAGVGHDPTTSGL